MDMAIQAQFDAIAKQFNVNRDALERMTNGVVSRIKYFGIEKFKKLPEAEQRVILSEAVAHWFHAQQKITNDYLMNKNGCREKLQKQVWKEIQKQQKKVQK
ncbi:hypothetical protein Ah1_00125 [Aeromonas phage Ah1]|uniref:Uncharacterized protein n=1 Tax=Aeromonas phage Ah1 TaxID=2053701 RepID=A0A2H4YFE6_9CAUD|nr:hypothetical protein KNT77_gp125 [Aeromonas phage Ah1]AUE22666.1 hypothetical protein Ah1_00125 [Aeromonas phage Ah1]UYD60269.1 hypothetical protein OPFAMLBM_00270 [Aeromonas phage avDM12-TAAL]